MNQSYKLIHKKVGNLDIYINPNLHKHKAKKKKQVVKRKSFYLRQMIPFPVTIQKKFIKTILYSDTQSKPDQDIEHVLDKNLIYPSLNSFQLKPLKEFKNINKSLSSIAEDIFSKKVRAGLIVTNEKKSDFFGSLDGFIKFHLKHKRDARVCLIDLDLFENSVELEFPESLKFDNFLRIALRKTAYNYVHRNDIQFAFFTPPSEYIICEMHFIYLFERLFFEAIRQFEPTLVVCVSGSNFCSNSRRDNFILSGDCRSARERLIQVICYMIERIQKQINSNLIFFSKFHANDHTHNYLNSLVCVLQNQGFPNPHSSVKIVCMEYLKNIAILEKSFAKRIEDFKRKLKKIHFPVDTPALQAYEHKIIHEKKRMDGIIGGHQCNIRVFPKYFVKRMSSNNVLNEVYIYYMVPKFYPKLAPFMIKCFGLIFTRDFDFITNERLKFCEKFKKFNSEDVFFIPFEK